MEKYKNGEINVKLSIVQLGGRFILKMTRRIWVVQNWAP